MTFATTLTASHTMSQSHARAIPHNSRRVYGALFFGAVIVLGLVYLFQTNAVATKGYEIKQLSSQRETLRQSGLRLQVQAAELQSMKSVGDASATKDFVAVERIEYLGSQTGSNVGIAVR